MNKLPNELLSQIIGEVQDEADGRPANALTPLVCVSKLWMSIAEPFVWREVLLNFHEIETFRRYFANNDRRKSLRVLRLQLKDYFDPSKYDRKESQTSDDESETNDREYDETEGSDEESDESSDEEIDPFESPRDRINEAMSDHSRLFLEVQTVWDELHSWKKALRLDAVRIYIGGQSLYRLLGPGMRSNNAVRGYIIKDGWLRNHTEPPTTKLISVKSLTVIASKAIQIWPAIVGCAIAESLPNLEELRLFDMDWDKKWWLLRSELRDVLAHRITTLSQKSLRTFELRLPFKYSMNHQVQPPNLLRDGVDTLSRSLNSLLTNLTTLAINVNHLSPILFWDPSIKASRFLCPNLRSLHVDTGFETASGEYIMRDADFPNHPRTSYFVDDEELGLLWTDPEQTYMDPEVALDMEFGDYPISISRLRPVIAYFDKLAIGLAHAATHMPRLESITIEFVSHFTDRGKWTGYHGWGFTFRAGFAARYPETHTHAWCGHPGVDMHLLESPRREWTFRCDLVDLQWDEPDEAKLLWEERFPGIESDIICFDYDEDGNDCWQGLRTDVKIRPEEMMDE